MSLPARVLALKRLQTDYMNISKELQVLASRVRTKGAVSVAEVPFHRKTGSSNVDDEEEAEQVAGWYEKRERLGILKGVQAKVLFRKVPIALSRIERLLKPRREGRGTTPRPSTEGAVSKGIPLSKTKLRKLQRRRATSRAAMATHRGEQGGALAVQSDVNNAQPTKEEAQHARRAAADAFLAIEEQSPVSSTAAPSGTAGRTAGVKSLTGAATVVLGILDSLAYFERQRQLFLEKEMMEYRMKCRELSGIFRSKTAKLRRKSGQAASGNAKARKQPASSADGGVSLHKLEDDLVELVCHRIATLRGSILSRPYTSALMWVSTMKFPILGTTTPNGRVAAPSIHLRLPYVSSLTTMVEGAFRASQNQHALFSDDGVPEDVARSIPQIRAYRVACGSTSEVDTVINSQSPRFVATAKLSSTKDASPAWMPSPAHGVTELILKSLLRIATVLRSLCVVDGTSGVSSFVEGFNISIGEMCSFTKTLCSIQRLADSFLGSVEKTERDIDAQQHQLAEWVSRIEQHEETLQLMSLEASPANSQQKILAQNTTASHQPTTHLGSDAVSPPPMVVVDPFASLGLSVERACDDISTPSHLEAVKEEYHRLQGKATDLYMHIQAKSIGVQGVHNVLMKLERAVSIFVDAAVNHLSTDSQREAIPHMRTINGVQLLANLWSLHGLFTLKAGTAPPRPDSPLEPSSFHMSEAQTDVFIALMKRGFPQVKSNTASYLIARGKSNNLDTFITKRWKRKSGVRSFKDVHQVMGDLQAAKVEARLVKRRLESALRASRVESVGRRLTEEMGMHLSYTVLFGLLRCFSSVSLFTLERGSRALLGEQAAIKFCMRQIVEAIFVRLIVVKDNKSESRQELLRLMRVSCSGSSTLLAPVVRDAATSVRRQKEHSNVSYLFLQYVVQQLRGALSARLHHVLASESNTVGSDSSEAAGSAGDSETADSSEIAMEASAKTPLSLDEISTLIAVLCKVISALPQSSPLNSEAVECLMLCKVFLVDEDAVREQLIVPSDHADGAPNKRLLLDAILDALQGANRLDAETRDLLLDAKAV